MKITSKGINLIIFFYLIFIASSVNAQKIDIAGVFVDSISKTVLPYGSVSIKNINDSIAITVITNERGKFLFKNISFIKGMYLSTHYLGYQEKIIQLTPNIKSNINLGKILLVQKNILIDEAVVEGSVNYVVKKFDRKVYTMDAEKTSTARTVLDLLRVLPGVVVDNQGTVRYKGSEAVIYVDEQPLNFQFPNIEMIPVIKVNKIELIDASMYSGGNGQSGIINIKFKRVNRNGLSGMLSTKTSTILFKSLNKSKGFLNINYKNEKSTFFLNTSIENNFSKSNSVITKNVDIPLTSSIQSINLFNKYQRKTNFNNVGVIYWLSYNTKLYLSCGFYTLKYKSDIETNFIENYAITQQIQNSYFCKESSNDNQLYEGVNFSYWHKFDTLDTYIKIFGNFNIYKILSKQNSDYYFNKLNTNILDSVYSYGNDRQFESNGINLNIFYNHSISKKTRWNLSYNLTIGLKDTTANEHFVFNNIYLPQSQFDANNSHRHNLSWRIGIKFKEKWKVDGGLNIVDYFVSGNYTRYNNSNFQDTIIALRKNYFRILPSATFTYEVNDKKEIKFTLSKNSTLPNFNKLSNYIDKKELYNWYSGNSELKSVDFYSAYLGYSYNINKCNASAECFYNYTNNEVANISIPLTSQLTLTRPENVAQKSNIGIDLSTWVKLNKQLNFSLSSTFFYLLFDISTLKNTAIYYNLPIERLTKKEFGYNIKLNFEYKFKEYYTMFYFNYYAKKITFNGYYSPWINSSISLSKKYFDKKIRISVGINNIFDDMIEHSTYSSNFGIISNIITSGSLYKRFYFFSIQYNFNKGDRGTKNLRIGG
ncbi:MAG: TonB-dependent receptor [Bacteroidetes bacterium]|nr:TonB-dependent receptor [Bacteroidota bacterium]